MNEKKIKKYLTAVKRRLNLPKEVRERVMSDLESDLRARAEAGATEEEILSQLGTPKKAAADLNEQMKEFAYRKSPWRFACAAAAVLSGGWLILYAILQRFGMLLNTLSITSYPNPAASIGIIGGADGPTAIFVTGAVASGHGLDWDVILVIAVFAVCILGYLRLRKCKQKKKDT